MVIVGIDPGLASTGFGVVARLRERVVGHAAGVIETDGALPLEQRLAHIHGAVAELLDEHQPGVLALEQLYFGQNARTAFAVGQARGAVMLAAGQRQLPCFSYTPQQVKAAVCGTGRAGKDQVARMVAALLGLPAPPSPDHAADALAVAICHANRTPLQRSLAGVMQAT